MIAEADSAPFVGVGGADRSQTEQQHVIQAPAAAIAVERPARLAARHSRAAPGTRRPSPVRAARERVRVRPGPNARRARGRNRPELSWAKVRISPSGSSRRGVLRSPHSTRGPRGSSEARYAATASCVRILARSGAGEIGEWRLTTSTSPHGAAQRCARATAVRPAMAGARVASRAAVRTPSARRILGTTAVSSEDAHAAKPASRQGGTPHGQRPGRHLLQGDDVRADRGDRRGLLWLAANTTGDIPGEQAQGAARLPADRCGHPPHDRCPWRMIQRSGRGGRP